MKYLLPLENDIQKSHLEMSNAGKELKRSNIIPIVNDDKSNLQNGVIYVESPFQKDEYFDITKFNQQSQDRWREIIKELARKVGVKKFKTTLIREKEDNQNSESNTNFEANLSGNYKLVDADASVNNTNSSKKGHNEQLSSFLECELKTTGEKYPIDDVEKWIKDKKIDMDKNEIFRMLFDQFKNGNLEEYVEIQKIEQIITGFSEVDNTLSAIANVKSPLFSVNMQTSLNSTNKEEYRKYEKMEFKIEIHFK